MARDRLVNSTLESEGWLVLRFWGKKIKSDPAACAEEIAESLKGR